ncbi:MAG: pyruvate:ferredoxin (flavodoxin) oxidoreductase [Desulfobacterales bacterium]
MNRKMVTIDGNEAAAYVAHRTNEVIAIYPITPSSPMGEWADEWSARGYKNIWGTLPHVYEMQSEAGAAGALHGALQAGALATTFTASQGLLLMIPNMFKIAGELTATVFHVTARTIATHGLSIFGDHSDVMAARSTGCAMLAADSVQEAMDFALIAQSATLRSRVPFIHFFDGFRTSHEVAKVEQLTLDDMRAMIDDNLVAAHRERALTPDRPVIRGTAINPDVFFQGREASNPFYQACPEIVEKTMDRFYDLVGRRYALYQYVGAPDADRVLVIMGSAAETVMETVGVLNEQGEKVGLVKVRLYRPFSGKHFLEALPKTVKAIACLDRTKEPGSAGEPLYQDVLTMISEGFSDGSVGFAAFPRVVGGRYGLSSKEFTPAMVKGVFDELKQSKPKNHFTVGIDDDITHTSIDYDPFFTAEKGEVIRAMFYGLGADGTVGANKNSIKIIGEGTPNFAQGYFVYDSKKSGSQTVSHLRFGPTPIHAEYLVHKANFIACHQPFFLEKPGILAGAAEGAVFLLNSPIGPENIWDYVPAESQRHLIDKKMAFYVIDAYKVAGEAGLGGRINTVMQTCFFAISGVLPKEAAIEAIKDAIRKTYGKRGEHIVRINFEAVDKTLANLHRVTIPETVREGGESRPVVPEEAPEFVRKVTAVMMEGKGDELPVSAMPVDGTFPTGTTRWEKRNVALEIPIWDKEVCIQCGKCSLYCPHATIRMKAYHEDHLRNAPESFQWTPARGRDFPEGTLFTVQVAPEDCTGCGVCVNVCPAKNKKELGKKAINMHAKIPVLEREKANYEHFLRIPDYDRDALKIHTVKGSQLLKPLFEYSGACAGCGETPYIKLLTQLLGDRLLISNATGCSSIYGGNLPTTPYTTNAEGRGPAWSNSLFEDCAEFGLGMRMAVDKNTEFARELLKESAGRLGESRVDSILKADQETESGIAAQRRRINELKQILAADSDPKSELLLTLSDYLVKKSVWCVGGDGWAYDIGFGGLDHVISSGKNINLLVLDTEVYSNTGGQMSKATPRAAVAKFAAGGKHTPKKDLGMMMMTYRNVYVAQVAIGADDAHTVRTFVEAAAYDGPSLIIAYSHCIAHGAHIPQAFTHQKAAAQSGYWVLFRFNPDRIKEGRNPLQLDSKEPSISVMDFAYQETRYKMLSLSRPEEARKLIGLLDEDAKNRYRILQQMAAMEFDGTTRAGM